MPKTLRLGLPLGLVLVALLLLRVTGGIERAAGSHFPIEANPRLDSVPLGGIDRELLDEARLPVEHTLSRGETLETVFRRFGLPPAAAQEAIEAAATHLDPRKMRAGDPYTVLFAGGRSLSGFSFNLPGEGWVLVDVREGTWRSSLRRPRRHVERLMVSGSLEGALEASLVDAGGHALVAYRLADVLQWDLDFNRDLRLGDRFRVLYDVIWLDGEGDRPGDILGLVYENRGETFEAYLFDGGYYDGEGKALRKQFLRSPLEYSSRITSRFSHRRFHPVLKTHRAHLGVDYGAPVGTPVRVTANGVVDSVGWQKGGGRTVRVRHPNGFVTAYLHLSRYASGMSRGRRVQQGEVVGFVGATGLATGPHLDYRVQQQGRYIDPLSLKSEPAAPIPETELPRFFERRDRVRRQLFGPEGIAPSMEDAASESMQTARLETASSGSVAGR